MLKKKYISTGSNPLSIDTIAKDGGVHTFDFRGGVNHPVFIPPSYTTKNKAEQELIESHPTFNISYRLEKQEEVKQDKETHVKGSITTGQPEEMQLPFKNAQEAREWMVKEKGVTAYSVRNKELMLAKAEELGFSILLESEIN